MRRLFFGLDISAQIGTRLLKPRAEVSRFKRQSGSVEGLLVEYGETAFRSFQVGQFVLFESKQSADGSVCTVIERFQSIGT